MMLFFSFFFVGFFPFRSLPLVNFHPQKRAKQQQRNSTEVAVDCREINSCTHTQKKKKNSTAEKTVSIHEIKQQQQKTKTKTNKKKQN